jgi:tetratricopeptide (TPR) repeat protein
MSSGGKLHHKLINKPASNSKSQNVTSDATDQHTPTTQSSIELALQQLQTGNLADAKNTCIHLLQLDSEQPDALHILGILAQHDGNDRSAIHLISKALKSQPNWPDALINLGRSFKKLGDLDSAERVYRQLLDISPHHMAAHNNMGLVLMRQNRLSEAVTIFQAALAISTDDVNIHINLGLTFAHLNQFEDAGSSFRKAIGIDPENSDLLSHLGNALRKAGDLDGSLANCQKAVRNNPDSAFAQCSLGYILFHLKQYSDAYEHLIQVDQSNAEYRNAVSAAIACLIFSNQYNELDDLRALSARDELLFLKNIYVGGDYRNALRSRHGEEMMGSRVVVPVTPTSNEDSQTLFMSGDGIYLEKYLRSFLQSFSDTNNRDRVHVHALLGDEAEIRTLDATRKEFDKIVLSYSYEVVPAGYQTPTYYATIRFAVLSYLYKTGVLTGAVYAIDIDSEIRSGLDELWAFFKATDSSVGLLRREEPFIEQQVAAGAVYISGNDFSRKFLSDVSAYCCHALFEKKGYWYLDQIAIFMVYQDYMKDMESNKFTSIPMKFLDWQNAPESLIWTTKGHK